MQSCQGSRAYWQQVTACKISQSFGEKKGKTGFFLGNPWCCDLVDGEDSGVTCLVSLDLLRSWSSMHPRAWARLTSQLGQNWVPRVHESPLALENRLLQLCCNPGTWPFLFFYLLIFLWIFSPCSPVVSRLLGRALLLDCLIHVPCVSALAVKSHPYIPESSALASAESFCCPWPQE